MTERSIAHGTFTIERHYDVSPARVYAAWADPAEKRQWFPEGDAAPGIFEFREGGREFNSGRMGDGLDTVDQRRTGTEELMRMVGDYLAKG